MPKPSKYLLSLLMPRRNLVTILTNQIQALVIKNEDGSLRGQNPILRTSRLSFAFLENFCQQWLIGLAEVKD